MRKVVGIHSCLETLKVRPKKIKEVFLKKDYNSNPKLKDIFFECQKLKVPVSIVSPQSLDKICDGHQGVALDVSENPEINWQKIKDSEKVILLALDGLEDPQNLGGILRTSWLLGIDGILITENRSVSLTPGVCKIASGGAEHVPMESYNQLIEPFKELKEQGFWVYGLSEKAEKVVWSEKFPQKIILVAGSEVRGMKPQTQKACDELLKIPQVDATSSLNVSISLAISISECIRQIRF